MNLASMNAQAVRLLQRGRPDEAVSLLLEGFERLDVLNTDVPDETTVSDVASTFSTVSADGASSGLVSLGKIPPSSSADNNADQCSQYSIKHVASRAASEPSSRRYQAAASRAAEARLRQSRSLDEPLLQTVDSDVSDISAATALSAIDFGQSENQSEVESVEMSLSLQDEQRAAEEDIASTEPLHNSTTTHLESVALPEFSDVDSRDMANPTDEETTSSANSNQSVSENIFTFYQRAFVLTTTSATMESSNLEGDNNNNDDTSKQSAVLLYNMAVAHHNYALYRRDPVAAHGEFRTALVFYDMAFSMIQESLATEEDDEDFLLLLLAVLNNLGHIHAHRYNYLETQEMLSSLQEILAAIRPASGEASIMDCSRNNRDDFLFFYKNLVVYQEQEFAAAPAA
ncbi:expressed unknown protein [Seminavis robusta]|uniref:Uncharacterized protein n=1 Tax=Seminavis robusta TaxID=568900 RepID=A0A9N8HAY9_9STRA|nr:expressed unknown protein [Seminavis robusta]|eukprot:Sro243_g096760.1 n/a (401) ;mRNA; r:11465-12667